MVLEGLARTSGVSFGMQEWLGWLTSSSIWSFIQDVCTAWWLQGSMTTRTRLARLLEAQVQKPVQRHVHCIWLVKASPLDSPDAKGGKGSTSWWARVRSGYREPCGIHHICKQTWAFPRVWFCLSSSPFIEQYLEPTLNLSGLASWNTVIASYVLPNDKLRKDYFMLRSEDRVELENGNYEEKKEKILREAK